MAKKEIFLREATGLVKSISPFRAFVFNVMYIWPTGMFVFLVVGQGLFPGANLITASLITLIPCLIIAYLYAQLAAAFPRSGGDYVFVGRLLHPSLGFVVNFVTVVVNLSIVGVASTWIVTLVLAPMLSGLGVMTHNLGLSSTAAFLSTPLNEFAIGAVFVVLLPILLFFGNDIAFRIQTILFAIAILSIIVFIGSMLATPHSAFVANYNSLSSTSVGATIASAKSAGANLGITSGQTLLALVYTMLAVWGFTFSSYIGGEIKNPQRSQTIGMLSSAIFYVVLMTAVVAAAYYSMGHDFLASINYLALNANSNYTLPTATPTFNFLAAYGTASPIVLVIGCIGILAGVLAIIGIVDPFWIVRCLFAWSFDRVIPTRFADINEKYHVPYVSLIAIIIIDVFFSALAAYTPFSAYLTYNVTASFIGAAVVGLAAVLFPWRRKDLFSIAPKVTTRRVGGVPLIVILGGATIILGVLIAYSSLLPALVGPFNPLYITVTIAFFIAGFIIYFAGYFVQKSRGVPMDALLREIPPE